ncbi:MAG: hypothetical protein AAF711_12085 [Planctomycetota bacterium]
MSDTTPNKADRFRIRATAVVLVVLLIGSIWKGEGIDHWPLTTFPMYTQVYEYPPETAERLFLVMVLVNGDEIEIDPRRIFPHGRFKAGEAMIEVSFFLVDKPNAREQSKRTLERVAEELLPGREVVAIEGRRRVWDVDPMASPPLELNRPRIDESLGRFEIGKGASH